MMCESTKKMVTNYDRCLSFAKVTYMPVEKLIVMYSLGPFTVHGVDFIGPLLTTTA